MKDVFIRDLHKDHELDQLQVENTRLRKKAFEQGKLTNEVKGWLERENGQLRKQLGEKDLHEYEKGEAIPLDVALPRLKDAAKQ